MEAEERDWEWQAMRLRLHLHDIHGESFEHLFQDIAKMLWGTTFQPTIPMGRRGDLKCDGWRADIGHVYQCYGPRYGQANVDDALRKVEEDFRGAKDHWGLLLKRWSFVVGLYQDKVPSEILRLLATLSNELKVQSDVMHRDDIVSLARGIDSSVRARKWGRAPDRHDMVQRVTYSNIGRALTFIRSPQTQPSTTPVQLPLTLEAKIAFNLLPDSVRQFMRIGTGADDRVRRYIADRADPDEGRRIAAGFTTRYAELRRSGEEPAAAFKQLIHFAGGADGDADRDAAALAIVTYFFSSCQIFERPPEDVV